ncbi:hypothetical protein E0H26_28855 [Micromonospora zingiberis]|uniref:Uncharacterized protein n=1 Tax=Micromonospora zingiberis TaxID=2053011 RepID=A0A4V2LU78_9ACTN|nr:hypothetical protein [Micromonospora zingiberis]TCB87725.1 hypothetical protein E0H26_28855 [Micromonospora zingiberis]
MARNDRQVFRYLVDFGGGERDVVSLLEPDWVFQHGLHPEAVMAVVREGADPDVLAPADVQENGPFLRLLSRVVFENIDQCGSLRREAEIQGSGYVFLLDERTPGPGGRVNRDDIVGAVEVSSGEPVAGSYQHNPRHRLFTAAGWFRLPTEIEAALYSRLRARANDQPA